MTWEMLAPDEGGKPCTPVPCPAFTDTTLEVTAVCTCIDLGRGVLYMPGCPIHDLDYSPERGGS